MWSPQTIPGKPTILMVDASSNFDGWESEFCDRLFTSMSRRGIQLKGSSTARVKSPEELLPHLEPRHAFNCILVFGHDKEDSESQGANLNSFWTWLSTHAQLSNVLFAACSWEKYDAGLSREILEAPESFATMALAPQSALSPREASLFFLKFFTELDLHSTDSITGKMVWFACSKSRELLRRRRLSGKVGARC